MKRILSLVAVTFVVLLGVRAFAQTPAPSVQLPTVDQVLDKFVTAIGGKPALEKHASRVSKGTLDSPDAPINGTVEVSEKAPNKNLTVINIPAIGIVRDGTDGTISWEDDPTTGLREKTGTDLADSLRDAIFNSEIKMKDMYPTIAVTGRETVGGKPAFVVLGTPKTGTPTRYWFDADSGLMIRQQFTRDTPQGPIEVNVFLEDYREVDGVKTPFLIRQVTPIFTMIFHLGDIKYNVALDDAIFKKPGLR